MHLADEREDFCAAVQTRFEPRRAKARIKTYPMVAAEAAEQIVPALNPHGFNFAFLDPFGLEGLPFSIIQTFARFKRMDVLIYFSAETLQRNLPGWTEHPTRHCPPDEFAPDWLLFARRRAAVARRRCRGCARASRFNTGVARQYASYGQAAAEAALAQLLRTSTNVNH